MDKDIGGTMLVFVAKIVPPGCNIPSPIYLREGDTLECSVNVYHKLHWTNSYTAVETVRIEFDYMDTYREA